MSDRVLIVGVSGGIDSQACALWVRRQFPSETVYLVNSDAGGNEHPMTTEFLHDYSRRVHPVTFLSPIVADLNNRGSKNGRRALLDKEESDPLTFDDLVLVKDIFPARLTQFCTYHLKLLPQVRWMDEVLRDDRREIIRFVGVRADESEKRKYLPEEEWDSMFDCELRRPLLRWTKQECFDYVTAAGEEFNQLYKLGFTRVGCAPCVNSGKEDICRWATLFPEMIDKVRGWEQRTGKTFFRSNVPGKPRAFIDDVVAWSKTARGGKQGMLPMIKAELLAGSGCSSKYSICE